MFKKYKGWLTACALALFAWSGSSFASPVTVDGVTWNTSNPLDLTIQSINLRESSVSKVGDTLTGYGQIGSINGNNNFCSNCDLTFTFSYTVHSISGNAIVFDGGSFQFYVSSPGGYNVLDPSTAMNGTEWLTLSGHSFYNPSFGSTGDLFATVTGTVADPLSGSNGYGLLDASGGAASPYLNTNSISDGHGGFADFSLNSSFQYFPAGGCTSVSTDPNSLCYYPIEGNGSLVGKSSVPEPAGAGMLGLGLGFLAFAMRRRRKESSTQA
ncbi:PEP-CTERM sorting domain-containing protein [Dyella sp. A6]|uniref:PEP-CTERM sorting domain-containing protein n=1 Tax=Dyella aluminiiresistens TaxID=3069105 RepID=UPI002E780626|nr:PEP-CTERM sorting domain-containing protein [Dyella sp. A6]